MVDFDAAWAILSALGAATLNELDVALDSSSFFTGAAFTVMSFDADRCGMFRMSLYFACLRDSQYFIESERRRVRLRLCDRD